MVLRVTAATPCTLRGARDLGHEERVTHALAGEGGQRALGRGRTGKEKTINRKGHNED